jgi:hypothetical protein
VVDVDEVEMGKTRVWDHKEYEDQMFYFNAVVREQRYEHDTNGEGFDNCYDCHAEIDVITNYLKKAGKECTPKAVCCPPACSCFLPCNSLLGCCHVSPDFAQTRPAHSQGPQLCAR